MYAFIRIGAYTAKAYDQGDDWQILTSDGNEYWASVWQSDRKASLYSAFEKACKLDFVLYDQAEVVIV